MNNPINHRMIANILAGAGVGWNLKSEEGKMPPDEASVKEALDKAREILYPREVETQLEVGGLIVRKNNNNYDVFVYTGTFD